MLHHDLNESAKKYGLFLSDFNFHFDLKDLAGTFGASAPFESYK